MSNVKNIIIAGLGGQGVLKASDILAEVVFNAGFDVKKSEIHGMAQRGGSVSSDIRFGPEVLSPMVPIGQADFLVCIAEDQVEPNKHKGGEIIVPSMIEQSKLANKRSINVALLGKLSTKLDIDKTLWLQAIKDKLPEKLHDINIEAFELGRNS
ncbi:MAG: 2-oxoacid:acceptor oxidoreductase family protein [Phycisphaerae bacterium]|nr:2-oxoacid:acceptor oxidoreductase family protein [Phycisphaerae bacterium]